MKNEEIKKLMRKNPTIKTYIEKIKIVSQPLYNYWIAVNRDSLSAKKKVYDPNILLYSYNYMHHI